MKDRVGSGTRWMMVVLFAVLTVGVFAGAAQAQSFAPPATTLLSPKPGTGDNPFPTFSWEPVPEAAYYQLWVNRNGVNVHREWLKVRTSFTLPDPVAEGVYTWWVQTWNPDGSTWSSKGTFTTDYPAVETPYPTSAYANNYRQPRYYWQGDRFTTWYRLQVRSASQGTVFDRWLKSGFGYGYAAGSDWVTGFASTHHYGESQKSLAEGDYLWNVREWRRGAPMGMWSSNGTLQVVNSCSTSPAMPNVTLDSGFEFYSGSSNAPRPRLYYYTPQTEWYNLSIKRGTTTYLNQWSRNNWWTSPVDMPAGDYTAWVTPYNACGLGLQSTGTAFVVNHPAPDKPSLWSPAYGYGFNMYGGIEFGTHATAWNWRIEPYTYWYRLLVMQDSDVFIDQWYDARNLPMNAAIRYSNYLVAGPNKSLAAGTYQAKVYAWNREGMAVSEEVSHTVDPLLQVTPLTPTGGVVTTGYPILDWTEEDWDAEQYQIYIRSSAGRYHAETVTPPECGIYEEQSGSNTFAEVGVAQGWYADDNYWYVNWSPLSIPFCGQYYSGCYVDSNGALYFENGQSDYTPDIQEFAENKMIAVLQDDLETNSGDIYVTNDTESVTIRWQGEYLGSGDAINVAVTLNNSGVIRLQYGDGNIDGGFIGVSQGEDEYYTVSMASDSGSMDNADDILFVPTTGKWRPHWMMPDRDYTWWVRPMRCGGMDPGPWSAPSTFTVDNL